LKCTVTPSPLSGGLSSFIGPTLKQIGNALANRLLSSPVTRTSYVAGQNLGQEARDFWYGSAEASLAQRSGTNDLLSPHFYIDAGYSVHAALNYSAGYVQDKFLDICHRASTRRRESRAPAIRFTRTLTVVAEHAGDFHKNFRPPSL
jgi:hypothetical protein